MAKNIDWSKVGFDPIRTDFIIRSDFSGGAWSEPQAVPFDDFRLDPWAGTLHYATSCFEGLKAFRGKDGKVRIFRPDENAKRMERTAQYLGIPGPSVNMFIEMCVECVKRNIDYLPPYGYNASMYLRPILLGVSPQVGLTVPYECTFAVMCVPVGSYSGTRRLSSVKGVIVRNYDRAAPNGSGAYKLSANYPGSFKPYSEAHRFGYTEMLFLNPATKEFVDEFGSSNFFGIKGKSYVTPLSDSVLPSITNKSLRVVAEDLGYVVENRRIPSSELPEFSEVAACGTAVVITPICSLDDKPSLESEEVSAHYQYTKQGEVGPVCQKLYDHLTGIQFGEVEDIHGWTLEVK